jgi:hypothetical protein
MALLEESRSTTTTYAHTAVKDSRSQTHHASAGRRHSTYNIARG